MTQHCQPAELSVSMLPTMYHYGILVATLCSLALCSDPESDPSGTASTVLQPNPIQGTDAPIEMRDFCFFGKFPSASCRFKCTLQNMESYCDDENSTCLCMPGQSEEEDSQEMLDTPHFPSLFDSLDTSSQQHFDSGAWPTPPHFTISIHPQATSPESEQSQDEADEKKHHVFFYIFDLNKIFGNNNQPETSTEGPTAEAGTQTDSVEAKTEFVAPAGWAFQHLMALLIIALLSVLIVLELYACYKKQRSKNQMESIFKVMPIPNKA